MTVVQSKWLAFAILTALAGACDDSGSADNDGDNGGGATAGQTAGTNAGNTAGNTAGDDAGGGTNAGTNAGGQDAGTTSGGTDGGGTNAPTGLPAASECGALDDGSGKSLDTSAAGGCYYFYCYTTEEQLAAAATQGGACSSPADVAIQCEGTSVQVVAECARANVEDALLEGTFTTAITNCAKPKLPGFSEACLACNVKSAVCAGKLLNCLNQCRDKDTPECDKCRQDKGCTPDFYDCAGLPDPMGG